MVWLSQNYADMRLQFNNSVPKQLPYVNPCCTHAQPTGTTHMADVWVNI